MRLLKNHLKKNLGVFLDSNLTMSKQLSNLCRTAYLNICIIRQFLTEATLVGCRILNRLDHCNFLPASTTSDQMSRIQHVQNSAAKVML